MKGSKTSLLRSKIFEISNLKSGPSLLTLQLDGELCACEASRIVLASNHYMVQVWLTPSVTQETVAHHQQSCVDDLELSSKGASATRRPFIRNLKNAK